MPGRKYSADGAYRYGFNGQEHSTEIHDNSYTAEYWEFDSRIGRRWNVDPRGRIDCSSYQTLRNSPLNFVDVRGDTTSHPGVDGRRIYTSDPNVEYFDGSSFSFSGSNAKASPGKGTVRSFTIRGESARNGAVRFVAVFDTKSGKFLEYGWDKDLDYTYDDFLEDFKKDLLRNIDHMDDPMWDPTLTEEEAKRNTLTLAGTVILPNLVGKFTLLSNLEKVLPKMERLNIFKERLSRLPVPKNAEDALLTINKTLDDVEDVYSGVVKNVESAMAGKQDGRMYGILDEKYVTRHQNGSLTAFTKGHKIEVEANGHFTIFNSDGSTFLKK